MGANDVIKFFKNILMFSALAAAALGCFGLAMGGLTLVFMSCFFNSISEWPHNLAFFCGGVLMIGLAVAILNELVGD